MAKIPFKVMTASALVALLASTAPMGVALAAKGDFYNATTKTRYSKEDLQNNPELLKRLQEEKDNGNVIIKEIKDDVFIDYGKSEKSLGELMATGKNPLEAAIEVLQNKENKVEGDEAKELGGYETVGVKLVVESANAINANQISVKFEGIEEPAVIDIEEALVEGENTVNFNYKGNSYTATVNYEAPDTEAPVISVEGETTISLENGAEFVLPVATATDNKDKEVKVTSVIKDAEGNEIEAIDTTVAGVYTITYSATDAAGNKAENVVVTVTVKEAKPVVESVSAINDTSVEVTFAKDAEVTAENLAGKKITLKDGETTLTATYADGSLANGKAVFNLAEGEKLVDATVYTLSSDFAQFEVSELTAKIANPYAKSFKAETTAVTASTEAEVTADKGEDGTKTSRTVKISAKDQYGEDIVATGLTVEGSTINGMPLTTGQGKEISITGDVVTLSRTLVEGDKLVIKVSNKDGDKVLGTSELSFTVGKAAVQVPTTVAGVKATVNGELPTAVVAGDTVTLTPDVRDQNNTPVNADVRYVVTAGADLLSTAGDGALGSDVISIDKSNSGAVAFKVDNPGTVTIDVFNVKNGAKYTYTVEVGAKKLAAITSPSFEGNLYNNEELKSTAITANSGAAFTPEMIKFNITDANGNATSDVTVSAKLKGGTESDKNDIILVAKTTKVGTYKITPYVGESFTATDSVKGSTITVTTALNPIATSIDAITVGTVKVGTPVTKEVVVRNKHNEDITSIVNGSVNFVAYKDGAVSNDVTVSRLSQNSKTKKYEVTINAAKAGEYTVRGTVSGTSAITDINVAAEETSLSSINLGQDIYDGVISGDDATYHIITAKDSKGDAILPVIDTWTVTAKVGATQKSNHGATIEYVKKDAKDNWIVADSKSDAQAIALKIDTANGTDIKALNADTTVTYTVTNGETDAAKKIEDSINVKVKAQRTVTTIEATPSTVQAGLGATAKVKVTPKDQYGKVVVGLQRSAFTFVSSDDSIVNDTTVDNWAAKGADGKDASETNPTEYYEFTVNTVSSGSAQLTVTKAGEGNEAIKSVVNVTVAPASDLVKSFTITGDNIENGTPKYKLNEDSDSTLSVNAKDANGNSVAVKATDIIWTSSNAKLLSVNPVNGKVTVAFAADGASNFKVADAKSEEVTVTAEVFGVEQTIKFVVSKEAGVAQAGTFALKQAGSVTDLSKIDGDAEKDGIQIYLDGKTTDGEANDGTIVLTYTAVDQFGGTPKLAGTATSYNTEVVTVSPNTAGEFTDTLTITPLKEGSTKVSVKLSDNQTVVLDVIVTDENANVIAIKADAQATADANAFKAAHSVVLGKNTGNIEISDKEAVNAAKNAYGQLSEAAKAKLTAESTLLTNLSNKIDALETAAEELATAQGELQVVIDSVSIDLTKGENSNSIDAGDTVTINDVVYTVSTDGSDVAKTAKWVTAQQAIALKNAISVATTAKIAEDATTTSVGQAKTTLEEAITQFTDTDAKAGTQE